MSHKATPQADVIRDADGRIITPEEYARHIQRIREEDERKYGEERRRKAATQKEAGKC
jgi:hypothetical protein